MKPRLLTLQAPPAMKKEQATARNSNLRTGTERPRERRRTDEGGMRSRAHRRQCAETHFTRRQCQFLVDLPSTSSQCYIASTGWINQTQDRQQLLLLQIMRSPDCCCIYGPSVRCTIPVCALCRKESPRTLCGKAKEQVTELPSVSALSLLSKVLISTTSNVRQQSDLLTQCLLDFGFPRLKQNSQAGAGSCRFTAAGWVSLLLPPVRVRLW